MKEDIDLFNKAFNFYSFIHNSLIRDNKMIKIHYKRNLYFPTNEYSQIVESYKHLFKEL
jgi:hypothetical protein